MVFKRYIKRGGKVFGPYYYESKRINGKIKSLYVGSARNKELIRQHGDKILSSSSKSASRKSMNSKSGKARKASKKETALNKKKSPAAKKQSSKKQSSKQQLIKKQARTKLKKKLSSVRHKSKPAHHQAKIASPHLSPQILNLALTPTSTGIEVQSLTPANLTSHPAHQPKKHPKQPSISKKLAQMSTEEILDFFNETLLQIGKAINLEDLEQGMELYEQLVHAYNQLKSRVSYEDSLKLFNTIKQVYKDLNDLKEIAI
jgi:hypothetical protein